MIAFGFKNRGLACLLALATVLLTSAASRQTPAPAPPVVVIVAHTGVPLNQQTSAEMKNLLLGKSTKWDDGTKVVLVNQRSGEVHEAFVKEYTGKTPSQYKTYWKKRVFTGKGKAPKSVGSDSRVIDLVAKTPGAVGYISYATSLDPKIVNDPKTKEPRVQTLEREGS